MPLPPSFFDMFFCILDTCTTDCGSNSVHIPSNSQNKGAHCRCTSVPMKDSDYFASAYNRHGHCGAGCLFKMRPMWGTPKEDTQLKRRRKPDRKKIFLEIGCHTLYDIPGLCARAHAKTPLFWTIFPVRQYYFDNRLAADNTSVLKGQKRRKHNIQNAIFFWEMKG